MFSLLQVFCSGEGLRIGTLGKDIRSFIDTRKAGPGELSLHCVGPRGKTAYCELNDHQDGTFTLNLKPQVRHERLSQWDDYT
jgi:filamin